MTDNRSSFELYKSNVCHRVKEMGDVNFIIDTLERDDIRKYYQLNWYPESLYLLAMLDYVCRINSVPLCRDYDDLRRCRLNAPIYPASVLAASIVSGSETPKDMAFQEAIPEFLRFNIVENEVYNVV